jgi:hypothetical protein
MEEEWDALNLFRALPHTVPLFQSTASELGITGSQQSGKSLAAFAKLAAMILDRPIICRDGTKLWQRRPWQKDRPLRVWLIGLHYDHIGQTIYRMLFKNGAFFTIHDLQTRELREFRPWEKGDMDRELQKKQSPPLIPRRYIKPKSWGWYKTADKSFTTVTIWNPVTENILAEIYAFPATTEKTGDPVDVILVDERFPPERYPEWLMRLSILKGQIIIVGWADEEADTMAELQDRADRQKHLGDKADVQVFRMRSADNPHFSADELRKRMEALSPEERLRRIEGQPGTSNRMYPAFSTQIHCAYRTSPDKDVDGEFAKADRDRDERENAMRARVGKLPIKSVEVILRETKGEPPEEWTHELILDPGTRNPFIMLGAIPPTELWAAPDWPYFIIYQEIAIPRYDARELARMVRSMTAGKTFERFIGDAHALRTTPMGAGRTVEDGYAEAFAAEHLRSRQTGSRFHPGNDKIERRIMDLLDWMTIGPKGWPKLRIVVDRCPVLCEQLAKARKKKLPEGYILAHASQWGHDGVDTAEYWSSSDPTFIDHPPPPKVEKQDPILLAFEARQKLWNDKHKQPDTGIECGVSWRKHAV